MSDILDLIDNAIEAWEVSGDAMRWTPEQPVGDLAGKRIGGFVSDERWSAILHGTVVVRRPDGSTLSFPCRLVPSDLSRATDPTSTEQGTT